MSLSFYIFSELLHNCILNIESFNLKQCMATLNLFKTVAQLTTNQRLVNTLTRQTLLPAVVVCE